MDLELVKQLMGELQEAMKETESDFGERLGKKPDVEVVKVEGEREPEMESEELPMEEDEMDFDEDEGMFKPKSEGMDLKKRLMALRGK